MLQRVRTHSCRPARKKPRLIHDPQIASPTKKLMVKMMKVLLVLVVAVIMVMGVHVGARLHGVQTSDEAVARSQTDLDSCSRSSSPMASRPLWAWSCNLSPFFTANAHQESRSSSLSPVGLKIIVFAFVCMCVLCMLVCVSVSPLLYCLCAAAQLLHLSPSPIPHSCQLRRCV